MVQDEVSRPALRQTVMTTNCGDTNHTGMKPRLTLILKSLMVSASHISESSIKYIYLFFTY